MSSTVTFYFPPNYSTIFLLIAANLPCGSVEQEVVLDTTLGCAYLVTVMNKATFRARRRGTSVSFPPKLPPADASDPVIEAYKKDVDRTLLRQNLCFTVEQRWARFQSFLESLEGWRGAAARTHVAETRTKYRTS